MAGWTPILDRWAGLCEGEGGEVRPWLSVGARGRGRPAAALPSWSRPSRLPWDAAPLRLQHGQAVRGGADLHEQTLVRTTLGGTDRHRRPQERELPLGASDRLVEPGLPGPTRWSLGHPHVRPGRWGLGRQPAG